MIYVRFKEKMETRGWTNYKQDILNTEVVLALFGKIVSSKKWQKTIYVSFFLEKI